MRRKLVIALGGVAVLLSLAGCVPILDKPYTTPSDTSAAHLALHFVARVDDATSWTAISYFLVGNTSVKFAKGERVVCEGVALAYTAADGTFSKSLPLKTHGASYACAYTSGTVTTPWQFNLPDPVQVTAPQTGDMVDRKNVTIRYTGSAGVGINVEADNGEHTTVLGVNTPTQDAPGIYQFSASPPLPAGAGRLIVHSVRDETPSGTGFAKIDYVEDVGTTIIPVTWT